MPTLVRDLDTPAVTIDLDSSGSQYPARAGDAREPRHGQPAAHQDAQDPGDRPSMQMAAGAVGITCQKLGEVEVFIDAGVADDILLTFNIVGDAKTDRLMELSGAREAPRRRRSTTRPWCAGCRRRARAMAATSAPDRMRHRLRPQRRAVAEAALDLARDADELPQHPASKD